jgi:hypothetical protein
MVTVPSSASLTVATAPRSRRGRDRVVDDVEVALVVHGELARNPARLLEREQRIEIVLGARRAVRVVGDGGAFAKRRL